MIRKSFLLLFMTAGMVACAQTQDPRFPVKEVQRIENTLASDAMKGRKPGTPEMEQAARFIADEFKKAGLVPLKGNDFLQSFSMVRPKLLEAKVDMDGQDIDPKNMIAISTEKELKVDEKSGYELRTVQTGDNFRSKIMEAVNAKKNMVVFIDSSFAGQFPRLSNLNRLSFKSPTDNTNILFVLGSYRPSKFKIKVEQSLEETQLANVVGIIPGKSLKKEYVIFSGHYDHLGIARVPQNGDSIFNGANDDAAGTTAVIMLANYFSKLKNNERTLVFAAFTAEEMGGYGSQYFSRQFDPTQVMAMFNIEMIGTESKWGTNSAYITGFDKSNMGEILQRNLQGSGFSFYPDPYTKEDLFYRSDNATLARLGVPAHTISTSKMDNEPNYHKVSDEVSTLDLDNMALIIKSIAISAQTIISGKDTPSRVSTESLK